MSNTDEHEHKTPLYLAYGPSKTGYPYGPQEIAIGGSYLILPGHGTKKHNCGEVRFGRKCSNEGCDRNDLTLVHENCGRITCPTCRDAAISRATERVVERVEGLIEAYENEGQRLGPLDHCQLSTRPDDPLFSLESLSTQKGINKAFNKAQHLMRRYCRGYGGVLVLHPWRQVHLDGSECKRHDCKRPHTWVWSPHFHFVGVGWWTRSDIFYAETGWTYSKFGRGVKARRGLDPSQRSLYGTVHYELTHCGVLVQGREIYDHDSRLPVPGTIELAQVGQVVRYVGMFANAKGGYKVESAGYEVVKCQHCGAEVHKWDVVQGDNGEWRPYQDRGPLQEWVEVRRWYINRPHKQKKLDDRPGRRATEDRASEKRSE